MSDKLAYEIVTPEALLASATAVQVVVPGADGDFGVLKGHAPFLSTIRPGVISILGGEEGDSQLFVKGGLAQVAPSGLTILAEESIDLETVDREAIAKDLSAAEAELSATTDQVVKDRLLGEIAWMQALLAA